MVQSWQCFKQNERTTVDNSIVYNYRLSYCKVIIRLVLLFMSNINWGEPERAPHCLCVETVYVCIDVRARGLETDNDLHVKSCVA